MTAAAVIANGSDAKTGKARPPKANRRPKTARQKAQEPRPASPPTAVPGPGETTVETAGEVTAVLPAKVVLEGEVVESPGDARAAGKPWDTWPPLDVRETPLHMLRLANEAGKLFIDGPEGRVGRMTDGLGYGLSFALGSNFPWEFIRSLSPDLMREVIDYRLGQERNRPVNLVVEDENVTTLVPGGRELLSHADLADVAYTALQPLGDLTIQQAEVTGHRMRLQLLTPRHERVTRKKDDILQMGVDVFQQYGQPMQFRLSTLRLVCLNGMTAFAQEYTWRDKEARTRDAQVAWVRETVGRIQQSFGLLVERARVMAATPIQGEPVLAFQATAHALGLRRDNLRQLALQDFNTERELVGDNQWALLNSFTRFATHRTDQPEQFRRDLAFRAGNWAATDQLVIAELSRTVAQSVGARILEARS